MRSIILRDYDESDIEVHRYITEALGVVPTIEITNTNGPEQFEAKIRSLDAPGDLFLGLVYQWCVELRREWLPSVDRLVVYMHRDNQFLNTDCVTIQPIQHKEGPKIIQAPFTVRPYFKSQVEGIEETSFPDIDLIWLGSETYPMINSDMKRKDYLDRLESVVSGRFRFHRQQKVHSMSEYAKWMVKSKIAIHIHGLAEHCFRFYESLYLKRCLIAQRFSRELLWADPGDLVPTFDSPEEAADLCERLLSSGEWKTLRDRQQEWFLDHHNEDVLRSWGHQAISMAFEEPHCRNVGISS